MGHIKLTDFGLSRMGLMNRAFSQQLFVSLVIQIVVAVALKYSVFYNGI